MSSADRASGESGPGFIPWKSFGKAEAAQNFIISKKVFGDLTAVADVLVIIATAISAKWIYIGTILGTPAEMEPYAIIGVFAALLAQIFLRRQSVYEFDNLRWFKGQVRRILVALSLAALVVVAVGYLLKISETYSRGWFLLWMAMATAGVVGMHYLAARLLRLWISQGRFVRRVALFGDAKIAMQMIPRLEETDDAVAVVGVFDESAGAVSQQIGASGSLSDLISLAQTMPLDEVLIVMPTTTGRHITSVVKQLSILPVDLRFCQSADVFDIHPKGLLSYGGVPVIEMERRPMADWGPIVKAVEDRVLSAACLLVFSPLMLFIALAIKLDSRGPVVFRQKRHGFNHRIITVYKFRTMTVMEDGAKVAQATRDDRRVTRIGRFLRKTSLDELPQLMNVLKGEMSLVGPRPHAIAHNEYYGSLLESYARRHKMKPGITGWAQINGYRGETDTPEKMRKRVEHDLHYIENWSLWFDIKILMLTPFYGFLSRNAF
ncbi:undecaprenyl-phosphate glucose phosphotransferase [Parvibaculum sp.]|uniref:undecaprenyl-phosphate glucose phosphotransferase n=1 Tax=Parvibaculum sp. TaxID=2024848 RepID=UPI000C8F82D2|nr:undecaprenyl-phosphate glucose phosphotransferase [Parvibaculum sp.]MAB15119.1 undecaprenyl-phosphate glucose phosphotransferase [Parvibaculum sp.]